MNNNNSWAGGGYSRSSADHEISTSGRQIGRMIDGRMFTRASPYQCFWPQISGPFRFTMCHCFVL